MGQKHFAVDDFWQKVIVAEVRCVELLTALRMLIACGKPLVVCLPRREKDGQNDFP